MKKLTQRLLCIGMALIMVLALAACGDSGNGGGASQVGTWELTDLTFRTIEQGKLTAASNGTITLYSDNSYVVSCARNTYYSSDGGETYNPTNYMNAILYGTYELVSEDAELGEKSIKITAISRAIVNGYDTETAGATDADKEIMSSNELIGKELYLGSDGKISEMIDCAWFARIGNES